MHPSAPDVERALNTAFSPHSPINQARFFLGRRQQLREVVDTVRTPGLHATIFGERGVGKTSLASIAKEFLAGVVGISRINCGETDSFGSVLRRSVGALQLSLVHAEPMVGFGERERSVVIDVASRLPGDETLLQPDDAAAMISELPPYVVLIFDEFDRLPRAQTAAFADFVKSLSDRGAAATVILVGVAQDIDALILSHASVERCLRQIPLPRMPDDELGEIVSVGLTEAGFGLASDAPRERILSVSQGFPHYTHLLTLYAARVALDDDRRTIEDADVLEGMRQASERAEQSHREAYYHAVTGTRKRDLWKEVVAACALAETDDRGFFPIRAAQEQLGIILGRPVQQQTLAYHMGNLTDPTRGSLLERTGPERRYRFRFRNPLMRPFILMKSMADGLVSVGQATRM